MDSRDSFIQSACPTVVMPRFGEFEPLEKPGHRFLVGSNGLWLELRRAWVYARMQISANGTDVTIPYGKVTEAFDLTCKAVPRELLAAFGQQAAKAAPNETAGWITWNEQSREFAFRPLKATFASPDKLVVVRPELGPGEHLVVDLHSHGTGPAFFSGTDNEDDRGEVKFAVVYGNCDGPLTAMSVAARLCGLGLTIRLDDQFKLEENTYA